MLYGQPLETRSGYGAIRNVTRNNRETIYNQNSNRRDSHPRVFCHLVRH